MMHKSSLHILLCLEPVPKRWYEAGIKKARIHRGFLTSDKVRKLGSFTEDQKRDFEKTLIRIFNARADAHVITIYQELRERDKLPLDQNGDQMTYYAFLKIAKATHPKAKPRDKNLIKGKIVELHHAGLNVVAIAKKLKIKEAWARVILKRNNLFIKMAHPNKDNNGFRGITDTRVYECLTLDIAKKVQRAACNFALVYGKKFTTSVQQKDDEYICVVTVKKIKLS
jgi:hypothetical protein